MGDPTTSPIRTCAGTGEKLPQEQLERFVYDDELGLLHDVRRKAPGRGAWVQPNRAALTRALKFGFQRAFKRKLTLPTVEELEATMAQGIRRRLEETLGVAARSGAAAIGGTALEEAMKEDAVEVVLIASDAGESTRKKFASNADRKALSLFDGQLDGASLGAITGRDFVAVLGVGGRLAPRITADMQVLEGVGVFGS